MAVFQEQAERDFVVSVVHQLRTDHSEAVQGVPEEELTKRVVYGIKRAREYELSWQNNLATFVTLMCEIGPDFDLYPVFHEYLTDDSLPPDERIFALLEGATEADWEDTRQASSEDSWPEDI